MLIPYGQGDTCPVAIANHSHVSPRGDGHYCQLMDLVVAICKQGGYSRLIDATDLLAHGCSPIRRYLIPASPRPGPPGINGVERENIL